MVRRKSFKSLWFLLSMLLFFYSSVFRLIFLNKDKGHYTDTDSRLSGKNASGKKEYFVSAREQQANGKCSKFNSLGWHSGTYMLSLEPNFSPNKKEWAWRDCARACALQPWFICEFWTLQLEGRKQCQLMTNKGAYNEDGLHYEGDRDSDCLARTSRKSLKMKWP